MTGACVATQSIRWRSATSPSGSGVWRTPPMLYLPLDQEFGFTLDVAADEASTQCDRFFDREADALAQSWAGEVVFCNPPYGLELTSWVEKAMTEADAGATVVMLLPARTGNRWFHRWVLPYAEVRFIQGRMRFSLGGAGRGRAPFDSMVVIFRPGLRGDRQLSAQPTFPFHER